MVKMGAYDSIPAAQRSWKNNINVDPGIFNVLSFAPLKNAEFEPDVVNSLQPNTGDIFVVNYHSAYRMKLVYQIINIHIDMIVTGPLTLYNLF